MKKITLLLVVLIFATFISCGDDKSKEKKEIAILKYVTHPALDELENSYVTKLDSLLNTKKEFSNYSITKYNANGNMSSALNIARSFRHKDIELVFTIATPAAIAVANNTLNTYHIYGAVADPIGAKIIPSNYSTGIQNAGESIIREALVFIKETFGDNIKIGTIYNPKEQNSIFVQDIVKSICKEINIKLKQVAIENTSQLNSVTNSLCRQVDVIYSANDNTVNSGVTAITSVTKKYKIPFVIGDLSTLNKGALFAVGLKYSSMGDDLAVISFDVLNAKSIKSYPPQKAPKPEIWQNQKVSNELNYSLNDSIQKKFNIILK